MQLLVSVLAATALVVAPFRAPAQTAQVQSAQVQSPMTVSELRQVFIDLGSYLDARRGSNLRGQFAGVSDDMLMKISQAIPDPRSFQTAVAVLKRDRAAQASSARQMLKASVPRALDAPAYTPVYAEPVYPDCPYNTIIDDSPTSLCNPGYPDPTNSAWLTEVSGPTIMGAFSPDDDYHISPQSCSLEVASSLQITANVIQTAIMIYTAVCGALDFTIAGEGGANAVCWATNVPFTIASGYVLADNNACTFQGGLVTGAQVQAAFHNTVTNYNALQGLGTQLTTVNNGLSSLGTQLGNGFTNLNSNMTTDFASLNTNMTTDFAKLTTLINTLNANLTALITSLQNQNTQSVALLRAYERELLLLQLTPDHLKNIPAGLLSCTGTNCPNTFPSCPYTGCHMLP